MPLNDQKLVEIGDLGTAFRSMTTLPPPVQPDLGRGLLSVWAWPLVGLLIGLVAALVGLLLQKLGMTSGLAAAGVLAAITALTAARHEAALLHALQGLFGNAPPEEDAQPHASEQALGILSLSLLTIARWSVLMSLIATDNGIAPVLAAAMLSRAALPMIMVALPPAGGKLGPLRSDAMAPPRASAALALGLALALSLFCLGWALIPAVAAAGVMAVAMALLGKARIGGRSPDLVSAAQPLTELAVLAALSAAL